MARRSLSGLDRKPEQFRAYASQMTQDSTARFAAGDVIRHLRFDYRGVVVDVDATFRGTDEWYEQMAKSRPPKDEPWYHVLVHDALHTTYVAERNLRADNAPAPIRHPLLREFFDRRIETEDGRGGRYVKDDAILQ